MLWVLQASTVVIMAFMSLLANEARAHGVRSATACLRQRDQIRSSGLKGGAPAGSGQCEGSCPSLSQQYATRGSCGASISTSPSLMLTCEAVLAEAL